MTDRTRLEYTDFQVTLHHASTDGNSTKVAVFEGLDADSSVEVPVDRSIFLDPKAGESAGFMERLDGGDVTQTELYEIGEQLADIALPTIKPRNVEQSVRERFIAKEAAAKATRNGALRIQLVIRDPGLMQLPWEFMAVKQSSGGWRERDFLALRRRLSIVRAGERVESRLAAPGVSLKVLAVLASPGGKFADLNLTKDREALQQAADAIVGDDVNPVDVSWVDPPTVDELTEMVDESVDVFYFGGHGTYEENKSSLVFQKKDHPTQAVIYSATMVGQLLTDKNVRLAVLGACDTGRTGGQSLWAGAADELIQAGVPHVVAYQAKVVDAAAGLAAAKLWEYTSAGFSIDQAIADARTEMLHRLRDSPAEWGKVVLHEAIGVSGRLFTLEAVEHRAQLLDVLTDEFAAWLGRKGASDRTSVYRSAVSEEAHDVIALESAEVELRDPGLDDPLASPYRPFQHFSFQDRDAFVRERKKAEAESRLRESAAVLITGPAGSGKTSLVLAGIAPPQIEAGHAFIRVAEYDDLAGQLANDLTDLGLADLPSTTEFAAVLESLGQQNNAKIPIIVLDQLEQLADPSVPTNPVVDGQLTALLKAAARGLMKVILVSRDNAEPYLHEIRNGVGDLEWSTVSVPYLTTKEAVDAVKIPGTRLLKTVHYAQGIPERIADELATDGRGVQPALLAVVCDRLWTEAARAGEQGEWRISGPGEGGVDRLLAQSLDKFLDEKLAGLSGAALKILGSPDLYGERQWAELETKDDKSHAQAVASLVQLGLLARRTRPATEYRYSSPAVRRLVVKSQPWRVRRREDAQATLDSITSDWQRDLLPSRGHLIYISASADQLKPTLDQRTLLIRASLLHSVDPSMWIESGAAAEAAESEESLVKQVGQADSPGRRIPWDSESGRVLGVPHDTAIEPPEGVGPYTWWALNGQDRTSRLTAGLIASVHDFGKNLDEAAGGTATGDERRLRRRKRQLWGILDDKVGLTGQHTKPLSAADRVGIFLARSRFRIARDRRYLGFHARRVGLLSGLILGLLQAVNLLLVGWPSSSRFTDALGEFFEYLVIGGLLGAAIGLGMQLPQTLGWRQGDESKEGQRTQAVTRFLGGTIGFALMTVLLELSEGRQFWRRPMTVVVMAISGALIAAAALYSAESGETEKSKLSHKLEFWRWPTLAAGSAIALLHWIVRLPADASWKGMLLFAKSRDNYFVVFNQLHSSNTPSQARSYLYMSLANTLLAGIALAGAARAGRRSAQSAAAELRRTEERIPAEPELLDTAT